MKIKSIYLVFFFFYSLVGAAQNYFSIKGQPVMSADSSYYYTEKVPGKMIGTDTIKFYYKSTGGILAKHVINKNLLDGPFIYYYENGQLKLTGLNSNGKPTGEVLAYYENGKPKSVVAYKSSLDISSFSESFKLLNYWDNQGNELVKNGYGTCKCEFEILSTNYDFWQEDIVESEKNINYLYQDFDESYLWEGSVKDGLRNSIWKAYRNGVLELEEHYDNGSFVFGTRFNVDSTVKYTALEEVAEPEKGIVSFYKFVGNTMRYPADARRKGIEGKVFVQFIVNRDGSLSNVKSIRAPHAILADEAVRVVKIAPKWKPGKQRGKAVRQKMVIPLIFRLG